MSCGPDPVCGVCASVGLTSLAVGRFDQPKGCVVLPPGQVDLCPQHVLTGDGPMHLVEDYTLDRVLERGLWP